MGDAETLRGVALQLRALADAFDDLGSGRVYSLREEAMAAFRWLVSIRDGLAEIELKARDGMLTVNHSVEELAPPPSKFEDRDEARKEAVTRRVTSLFNEV